jgi:hypothetical protein
MLRAHNRQARPFNRSLHFKCVIRPHETYPHYLATRKKSSLAKSLISAVNNSSKDAYVNILYTGNCTGEYFGIGPVCRCQEAMRFFNTHLANLFEWFVFIDDDVFMRPVSLLTMLHQIRPLFSLTADAFHLLPRNRSLDAIGSQPAALVSSSRYRGFLGSKSVWKKKKQHSRNHTSISISFASDSAAQGEQQEGGLDCAVSDAHDFSFAQPAIINRCPPSATSFNLSNVHANIFIHAFIPTHMHTYMVSGTDCVC